MVVFLINRICEIRMIELNKKEIQNIELNILLEFSKFCNENKLRYYLVGGTLLGAIRHKGFIPWDDDIDVCMPRPDYELFISNFHSDNSCLKLCCNKFGNLKAPFAKLKDTRTIVVNDILVNDNDIDTNLWIDIFPVDGLPDSECNRKKHIKKQVLYDSFYL